MSERGDFVVDVDLQVNDATIANLGEQVRRKTEPATESLNAASRAAAATRKQMDALALSGRKLANTLTPAGREAHDLAVALMEIGQGQQVIAQGFKNLQTELTKQRTVQRQYLIAQREDADRARQADFESQRAANSRLAIEQQRAAQSQLIRQRQTGQQRIQIARAVFENLGRFEKGFGAAIAGTARTATSAIGRAFDTLTSRIRNTNRVFTEGTQTSLSRREGLIRGSFTRQERLVSESVTRQQRTIQRLNTSLSTGVTGALTGRGLGVGLAGIGGGIGFAGLLSSGFERFSNLERINKQFLALTGNIDATNMLLEQVKDFAKTTPFDLVGVADLAKGFLAIGTSAEDVIPRVKAIADAVALTGGGVDELNRIQRAIGQVVSAGRLQGDELNQLAENLPGLNIRQILADQLTNGNVRTLVEMQEAGEITSDLFVTGLINGLQSDRRLVGASEDLANTLSGRVANLKESFADLGAAIIGTVAGPLKSAASTTQTALQGLADFIKGEITGPLLILRSAFKGAAAGVGTLLAAKGASEALRLLAASARLVLTPFGLMLTAAAALGALFNVMYERSPELRLALKALGEQFGIIAAAVRERVAPVLAAIAGFIANTVLPAIDELSFWLAGHLLEAFRAVSGFLTNTAYPAIVSFGQLLVNTVVPALVTAGGYIANAFVAASDAVARFAKFVQPYLQPAIDGFAELGAAIGDAFGGNFSGLASGAGAAAAGIGGALANIGIAIGNALLPLGKKIIEGLKGIFTTENLLEVGKAALNVIETIGYVLGNIVSDPRFITALAAVAAAAALVALRFAEGVAKGIAENLPELVTLALGGLKKLLSTAVAEALFDPQVLAVAVTAALVAPGLIRAFRSVGDSGGKALLSSFTAKVGGTRGFLTGLFGGSSGVQSAAAKRDFVGITTEVRDLQNELRILGSTTIVDWRNVKDARDEIGRLKDGLTDAEIAGLRVRDRLGAAFAAGGSIVTGLKGVGAGVREVAGAFTAPFSNGLRRATGAFAEFLSVGTRYESTFKRTGASAGDAVSVGFRDRLRSGAGAIGVAFTQTTDSLREIANSQGTTVGKMLAGAIGTALSAAAVGVGSFVAGKAEGAAGGSGALSAIGAGLTGLAIGGPIVGAAAAGLSLIGTSFGKASKAAQESKNRIAEFAGIIANDFTDAMSAGADGLLSFTEVLTQQDAIKQLRDNLADVIPTLNDLGIGFDDVINAFQNGGIQVLLDSLEQQVRAGGLSNDEVGAALTAIQKLKEQYDELASSISKSNAVRIFTGDAQRDRTLSAEATRLQALADAYGITNPKVKEFNDAITVDVQPQFTDSMQQALDDARVKADEVSAAIDKIFGQRDPESLKASFDAAILNVAGSFSGLAVGGNIIDQAKLSTALDNLRSQLSAVTKAGLNEGAIYDEATLRAQTLGVLGAALDGVEDPALRDAITQAYNDGVANALPTLNTQNIFDQLAAGLAEPVPVSVDIQTSGFGFQSQIDKLAGALFSKGKTAGGYYGDGLDSGIRAKVAKVVAAATSVVEAAKNAVNNWWGIASPSKVAIEQGGFYSEGLAIGISSGRSVIAQAAAQAAMSAVGGVATASAGLLATAKDTGLTIGKAIADGLADAEADMTSVVSNAVDNALKSLATIGSPTIDAATSAAAKLFAGVTGSDAIGAGGIGAGAGIAQTSAITDALSSFLSNFDSNVSKIFEVNAKKLSDLTAAEREIFGTNVFSLDPNSVFGASNTGAIVSFLDDVAALGESLIAKGTPLENVRATLVGYVNDLLTTAQNLGFNRDQLDQLVASLGLSGPALDEFIRQVKDLNTAAAQPGTPPSSSTTTTDNTIGTPDVLPQVNTFYITLPTGDPYAAALTIANRQAAAATLPGI